jgi:hypothetical protein
LCRFRNFSLLSSSSSSFEKSNKEKNIKGACKILNKATAAPVRAPARISNMETMLERENKASEVGVRVCGDVSFLYLLVKA